MVIEQFLLVKDNENNKILVKFALRTSLIWDKEIALNEIVERITKATILLTFLMRNLNNIGYLKNFPASFIYPFQTNYLHFFVDGIR